MMRWGLPITSNCPANPTISASLQRGEYRSLLAGVRLWFRRPVEIGCDQRTSWTTLTNAPALVGTNWQVSLPATDAAAFFQLIQQ